MAQQDFLPAHVQVYFQAEFPDVGPRQREPRRRLALRLFQISWHWYSQGVEQEKGRTRNYFNGRNPPAYL